MTKRIVDALEMIEIEIKNGDARAVTVRTGNFMLHCLSEYAPVRKSRQNIVTGQPGDLELAGGDFGRHSVEGRGEAVEFRNPACTPGADRPIAISPTCRNSQQTLKRLGQEPSDIDQGEDAGNQKPGQSDGHVQPDRSIDIGDDLLLAATNEHGEAA